jgi:hypothetical protein
MPPGKLDDPPRAIDRETFVNLRRDLLRRVPIFGVVQNGLDRNARPLHEPCSGNLTGYPFGIFASAPVDHDSLGKEEGTSIVSHMVKGRRISRLCL